MSDENPVPTPAPPQRPAPSGFSLQRLLKPLIAHENRVRGLRVLKRGVEIVALALASVYASKVLQSFSGSALWLPKEWRVIVQVLATVIGLGTFFIVLFRRKIRHARRHGHGVREKRELVGVTGGAGRRTYSLLLFRRRIVAGPGASDSGEGESVEDWKEEKHNYLMSVVLTVLLAVAVSGYMLLRGYCVRSWDPRDFQTSEAVAERAAAARAGVTEATVESSPKNDPAEAEGTHKPGRGETKVHGPEDKKETLAHVPNYPDFVNVERGEFYLPLWFSGDQRKYIDQVADTYHEDPYNWILTNEPDRIIDWLRGPSRMSLQITTVLFLALHLLCICLLAAAIACAYAPMEAALSLLERIAG